MAKTVITWREIITEEHVLDKVDINFDLVYSVVEVYTTFKLIPPIIHICT